MNYKRVSVTFIAIIILLFILKILHKEEDKVFECITAEVEGKYMHFSLDDVQKVCQNLSKYEKETIFADSTLCILKHWHDKYGIVASLFVQGDFTINSKYAQELIDNSHWLKFGYHGTTASRNKSDMFKFYKQVMDSVGSNAIIDQCPRIHYFHADYNTCMKLKELGCVGFLTCDDWSWNSEKRESNYYLSAEQNKILDNCNRLLDTLNNIYFVKTDFRLEHIVQNRGGVNALFEHYNKKNIESNELIIFSHEWCFNSYLRLADSIFSWASLNEYEFDYPENRVPKNNNEDI